MNAHKEIKAVGVEKKSRYKNTAMFLMIKTLKENELKDKQMIDTKLNKDK